VRQANFSLSISFALLFAKAAAMEADAVAGTDMRKINIYALGVTVLGLSHVWLRGTFSGSASFSIAVCYLLLLRVAAEKLGK
jgi:hypothetical protein